jgi:sec-independent protein translocase protein TatA
MRTLGGADLFQNLGITEILLILVVVLLIFGPSKLPQLGRSMGESLREFKKSMKASGDEAAASEKPEEEAKR